jgi:pre-mRNA-splicing factor SYF1
MSDLSPSVISDLSSRFPITHPVPTPLTHPHLITPSDLPLEEDLLHNPDNLHSWLSYIHTIKDRILKTLPEPPSTPSPEDILLGPLSSPQARDGLQKLTFIYERSLQTFPTSYKLWKSYYLTRQSYILGDLSENAKKSRAHQQKRGAAYKTNVKELLDGVEDANQWKGGLDGVVGFEEWKSLIAVGERMLGCISNLPVLWLLHLSVLFHPKCPGVFKKGYARRTFDRALRVLPPSLHGRIWGGYLKWAEDVGGDAGERVWRRFLKVCVLRDGRERIN